MKTAVLALLLVASTPAWSCYEVGADVVLIDGIVEKLDVMACDSRTGEVRVTDGKSAMTVHVDDLDYFNPNIIDVESVLAEWRY